MGQGKFATAASQFGDAWTQYAGRIVILGMCLIALLAAVYAQWHLYADSQRVLEYYGPDATTLIQNSANLELIYLIPATAETKARKFPVLNIMKRPHAIERVLNIAKAPGAIHARTALLSDTNYVWQTGSNAGSMTGAALESVAWEYALQFRKDRSTAIVAFAPSSGQAVLVGNDAAVSIAPIAQGMEDFRRSAEAQATALAAGAAAKRAMQKAK